MAISSNIFPLQNAIKKILDDPSSRPALPDSLSTGGGELVGDDNFSESLRYGTGIAPKIALNNSNVAVEVHQSENHKTLWYTVGSVNKDSLTFRTSHEYSNGIKPSVALNDSGRVVEVHQSENESTLWYSVGKVVGDNKIEWSKSKQYDNGERSSVAITNSGLVVEVHKSQNEDTLWYTVGEIIGDSEINWSESVQYDTGIRPSVAVNNTGVVVEIHQSENHEKLWYTVGELVSNSEIRWSKSQERDTGKRPSIAITDDRFVVEVHQSENENTLWYNSGSIVDQLVSWRSKSTQYGTGENPGVACNGNRAVETHSSRDVLSSSVLELSALQPEWTKKEGQYSFLFYQIDFQEPSNRRVVVDEKISVKPGAPYLIANLTKSTDSAEFPIGATLSITGPDGTIYRKEELSDDRIAVISSDSSLRSLIIKEPVAGDYTVSMTVPSDVLFSFSLMTLPFKDVSKTLGQSKGLQKRAGSGPSGKQEIDFIGGTWMTFRLTQAGLNLIREIIGYGTDSNLSIQDEAHPANVAEAVNAINQNIHVPNFDEMIQPPGDVTNAPPGGPVREYVTNGDGAVQWLHAEIRREHIGTGSGTNQTTRDFAQRLGLPNDDAGHIVGNQLGGTGRQTWNIFPQHRNFNRGVYFRQVETLLRDAARSDGSVEVWYRLRYENQLLPNRPTRFDILIRFQDGTEYVGDLYNPEFVPPGS